MAYILTAQLRDEAAGDGAFARYRAYIASVRDQLPTGAYALASSGWYFDTSDHRAPHDAWLEAATVAEVPPADREQRRVTAITIRLLGAYHDGWLEFHYWDVSRYRLELRAEAPDRGRGHRDWRYDEFRLAPGGRVEHEIEWWGAGPTATWLIEAADVEHRWLPRGGRDLAPGV